MSDNQSSGPVVWLGTVVATCITLYLFQGILWLVLPILLSIILYYVTEPLVYRLTHHGWTRESASGFVMGGLVLLLLALTAVTLPRFASKVTTWNEQKIVSNYVQHGADFVESTLRTVEKYVPYLDEYVMSKARNNANWDEHLAKWASDNSSGAIINLLHWIPSLLLIPYLTYFILVDGGRFKRFLVRAIPNAYFEKSLLLLHRIDDQVRRYFQGLMALTAIDAACLGIGLKLMGISGAFVLGIVIAVLSWIPYVGSIVGCLLVILVAATDYASQTWMTYAAVALFLGVRLLDDFVFMPMTIGRSLQIHPVVTVLMIFAGGAVAGISGLLLVMPVLGVMMVLGQILGQLATNDRLTARHQFRKALLRERAQKGLKA